MIFCSYFQIFFFMTNFYIGKVIRVFMAFILSHYFNRRRKRKKKEKNNGSHRWRYKVINSAREIWREMQNCRENILARHINMTWSEKLLPASMNILRFAAWREQLNSSRTRIHVLDRFKSIDNGCFLTSFSISEWIDSFSQIFWKNTDFNRNFVTANILYSVNWFM